MASKALFYMDNLTERGVLTATSAATGFPVSNLQDRDLKTYWKPSTVATQIITNTLTSALSSQACIIIHDNLYTLGYGLKVYGADDAGFTANVVYAVGSAGAYHAVTSADQPVWYERYAALLTKQYRRYELAPVGAGSTGVLVADIYDCPEIDTLRHPGGAWTKDFDDDTEVLRGNGFTASTSVGGPTDVLGLDFKSVPTALWASVLAGYQIVRTGFLPFWYIDENGVLNHVRLSAKPKMSHQFGALCDFSMQMTRER
jgi:hypothetical protein